MKHNELSTGEVASAGGAAVAVAIAGSPRRLSKIQNRFNQLIVRLKGQREELARWQAFRQEYQERMARDYEPLMAKVRARKTAMLLLFERALDGKALGAQARKKVFSLFGKLLEELLAERSDEELVRLHDKYADVPYAEERQNEFEAMSTLAQKAFGIDTDEYTGGDNPEELAAWIRAQAGSGGAESAAPPPTSRADRAAGGTRALREVFRKLVSELHPDREVDPAERLRKTELMKEVNRANAAGDLLRLLEIQLDTEQIDSAKIANLASDQLRHYIQVFEEQSQRLREEIDELVEPYAPVSGGGALQRLTPDNVRGAIEADLRALKAQIKELDGDLMRYQDMRELKASLQNYR